MQALLIIPVLILAMGLLAACGGPTGPAPVTHADRPTGNIVIVRRGDSAWLISQRTGVSLQGLIRANGLKPPYLLTVGQRLRLPNQRTHTVRSGESISLIAERYGISRYQLAQVNRIGPPYRIYPGQKLRLPGTSQPVASPVERRAARTVPPLPPARPGDAAVVTVRPATQTAPRVATRPSTEPTPRTPRPEPRQVTSDSKLIWPVGGRVISRFGPKPGGLHNDGVNIAAAAGTPVVAAAAGTVVYAGNELRGFGNLVLIRHGDGLTTAYAHLGETLVDRGQKVRRGEKIATVGNSGGVSPTQLHFEMRKGRKAVNPVAALGPVPKSSPVPRLSLAECGIKLRQSFCESSGE